MPESESFRDWAGDVAMGLGTVAGGPLGAIAGIGEMTGITEQIGKGVREEFPTAARITDKLGITTAPKEAGGREVAPSTPTGAFDEGGRRSGGAGGGRGGDGGGMGKGESPTGSDVGGSPFAAGGLVKKNHKYAAGGMVEGAGDGNDDMVDAQVSPGEFIIPADVVSALGDGDTDAGAQILAQLIEQTRQEAGQRMQSAAPPKNVGLNSQALGAAFK